VFICQRKVGFIVKLPKIGVLKSCGRLKSRDTVGWGFLMSNKSVKREKAIKEF
jgi:hypothetical protein